MMVNRQCQAKSYADESASAVHPKIRAPSPFRLAPVLVDLLLSERKTPDAVETSGALIAQVRLRDGLALRPGT